MERYVTDVLILGGGIAGLVVALSLDPRLRVTVLAKGRSNSQYAQGGIAAALGEDDSPHLHGADTLQAGVGLGKQSSIDILVESAPQAIQLLERWGVVFDRAGASLALAKEGAHRAARIAHAQGDATGAAVMQALLERLASAPNISLHTGVFALDLLRAGDFCQGAWALDEERQPAVYLARQGVVLATGGCGQLYQHTTNDLAATGDGLALAYCIGAALIDMEFVQFHPTALAIEQNPMVLISEAVRGEGARIVDGRGRKLLADLPWQDLAPRDVVARIMYAAQQRGDRVYLVHTMGARFAQRFPHIYRACRAAGIDPCREPIPITPAAHFLMGGVEVDEDGMTAIPHLYACGEVAWTGVHGANRLASNSLLEGIVFAQRIARRLMATEPRTLSRVLPPYRTIPLADASEVRIFQDRLRALLWEKVGLVRSGEGLAHARQQLRFWQDEIPAGCIVCRNMLCAARAITAAALWRQESRGGHFREDYPYTSERWETQHSRVVRDEEPALG